jgi:hypothetical protein
MYYTGIGSRKTPDSVLKEMSALAAELADIGFCLRSGKAEGADWAFQKGAMSVDGDKVIYIPDTRFGATQCLSLKDNVIIDGAFSEQMQDIAKTVHGDWSAVSPYGKKLHGRNVCQVLGHNTVDGKLDPELSQFVIYYARRNARGSVTGGTATAVRIANKYGIPTINMIDPDWRWQLTNVLNSILHQQKGEENA